MDCSPPGSSVHGIFQARALEWGAIAFSAWELPKSVTLQRHLGSLNIMPAVAAAAAASAKLLQSCPTLWDPIDGRPPGSAVPGILQARTLEWVAISFSDA